MKRNACQKCVFAVDDDKPHCGLRGFISDFNVERCSAENDTVPNGYELQEDGYFSWVDKKKEYPKTYEECLKVLGYDDRETYCVCHTYANERLFEALYRLKVCRDTYWKIAGEEMGLGKPWEPDWANVDQNKHCIRVDVGDIILNEGYRCQHILAFPTKEMRDAFYENFKELIESCKELL